MTTPGRVVVVIQARMGSTRLPGKVLQPLVGRPMVGHVVSRAARIPGIDGLVVAIPDLAEDDPLATYLAELDGIDVVRGSGDDVLDRYLQATRAHRAETVVRITADCPLLCPEVSGRVLNEFALNSGLDYASNTLERSYPRGLDTEVVSRRALEAAAREATSRSDREHVLPFIWRQPQRFALHSVRDQHDNSDLRWTVDTPEDFEMISSLLLGLEPAGPEPSYQELLRHARRHPELVEINRAVGQKELET